MPTRTSIPTGENHGATPATVHPLERRVLADATLDVVIGDGVARAVRFVDADGTAATVSVRGGTATVRFTGAGLAQTAEGRELVVGGTGVAVSSVTAVQPPFLTPLGRIDFAVSCSPTLFRHGPSAEA